VIEIGVEAEVVRVIDWWFQSSESSFLSLESFLPLEFLDSYITIAREARKSRRKRRARRALRRNRSRNNRRESCSLLCLASEQLATVLRSFMQKRDMGARLAMRTRLAGPIRFVRPFCWRGEEPTPAASGAEDFRAHARPQPSEDTPRWPTSGVSVLERLAVAGF
jgi:hypothetical protein